MFLLSAQEILSSSVLLTVTDHVQKENRRSNLVNPVQAHNISGHAPSWCQSIVHSSPTDVIPTFSYFAKKKTCPKRASLTEPSRP